MYVAVSQNLEDRTLRDKQKTMGITRESGAACCLLVGILQKVAARFSGQLQRDFCFSFCNPAARCCKVHSLCTEFSFSYLPPSKKLVISLVIMKRITHFTELFIPKHST